MNPNQSRSTRTPTNPSPIPSRSSPSRSIPTPRSPSRWSRSRSRCCPARSCPVRPPQRRRSPAPTNRSPTPSCRSRSCRRPRARRGRRRRTTPTLSWSSVRCFRWARCRRRSRYSEPDRSSSPSRSRSRPSPPPEPGPELGEGPLESPAPGPDEPDPEALESGPPEDPSSTTIAARVGESARLFSSADRLIATPEAAAIVPTTAATVALVSTEAPPRGPGDRGAARDRPAGDGVARVRLDQQAHDRKRDHEADSLAHGEPRPVDQLAHGAWARAERSRDLLMGMTLDRAAYQRLTLSLRQFADYADDPGQLFLAEHDVGRLADAVDLVGERRVRARVAARVQRPVADDRVEPWLQANFPGRPAQRVPRADEALLDDVLGPIRRRVGGREGDQTGPVSAHDLLEGRIPALSRERDKALIGLCTQDRSRDRLQARPIPHSHLVLRTARGVRIDLLSKLRTRRSGEDHAQAPSSVVVKAAIRPGPPTPRLSSAG